MWNEIQRRIRSLVFNLILYQGLCESKVLDAGIMALETVVARRSSVMGC